jgi:hypothetical protein
MRSPNSSKLMDARFFAISYNFSFSFSHAGFSGEQQYLFTRHTNPVGVGGVVLLVGLQLRHLGLVPVERPCFHGQHLQREIT